MEEFDGFYFLVFPKGDTLKITVIDLMFCVDYERYYWWNVNNNTYYNKHEAIADARDIAKRHKLEYVPFRSRYDSGENEVVYLY
jgi:hypothetical protein